MDERKTCTSCLDTKPHTEFYRRQGGGPAASCKGCVKAKQRRRREQAPSYRARTHRDADGKVCPGCQTYKPWTAYLRPRSGKQGSRCQSCETAADVEYKRQHAAILNRQQRDRYAAPVDPESIRRCPRCKIEKPLAEFAASGRGGYCKPCRADYARDRNRRRRDQVREQRYGLTAERFGQLLIVQGNGCAICGGTEITTGRWRGEHPRDLHVDHDHATEQVAPDGRVTATVRGLLCNRCNVVLGLMDDDPDRLIRAAEYLKNPPALMV